jgi:hypothetical protein
MAPIDRSFPARLLSFALWASALFGLAGICYGLYFVVDDARSHTDEFDGLGEFLGGVVAGVGLVWFAVHAALAGWLHRTRRRGRPLTAVGSVSAVAAVLLGLAGPITFAFVAGGTLIVSMLGLCLLVAVAGVAAAISGLRSHRVPTRPERYDGAGLGMGGA